MLSLVMLKLLINRFSTPIHICEKFKTHNQNKIKKIMLSWYSCFKVNIVNYGSTSDNDGSENKLNSVWSYVNRI